MTDKIKGLLEIKKSGITEYAKFTNRSQPNISNKIKRDSWNVKDLILLAKMTNTKLSFLDEDNQPIIFLNEKDLEENND